LDSLKDVLLVFKFDCEVVLIYYFAVYRYCFEYSSDTLAVGLINIKEVHDSAQLNNSQYSQSF